MYKRYGDTNRNYNINNPDSFKKINNTNGSANTYNVNTNNNTYSNDKESGAKSVNNTGDNKYLNMLTGLIPQSLYNPKTGKILGIISPEDLLIGALILLILDNINNKKDLCEYENENNSNNLNTEDSYMLILALLYLLLSEHAELPF